MTSLNFDALQSFAVFADSMNFSTAALQLHISQPALHVKIRKLGEQLDRPLYVRVGRALVLTTHGKATAEFGRQLAQSADNFVRELNGELSPQTIVLAAGEGAYLYLLDEAIRRFQKTTTKFKPNAALQLLSLDAVETVNAVLSGKAQVGVAPLAAVPTHLTAFPLTTVGQVLVVPHAHRYADRVRVKLKDLAGEKIIVPPPDRPHRQMLAALLNSQGMQLEVAVEANGWELMLSLVNMGMGVAVVNACCRIPKGLIALPIAELPSLQYYGFHLPGAEKSAAVLQLRQLLIAHANGWKARHKSNT
jgi:LysR family transcriptional regulator, low CO2-responsive transcriptional regulator